MSVYENYDEMSQRLLERFIGQLNNSGTANDPDAASVDLKYIRALQRARLARHGAHINCAYEPEDVKGVAWKMDSDTSYVTRIPFRTVKTDREYVTNSAKKRIRENQSFYAYAVWLKGQQSPNKAYACPNCGAVSTVGQLINGCEYCKTRFLMNDLYPKITCCYTLRSVNDYFHPKTALIIGAAAVEIFNCVRLIIEGAGNVNLFDVIFSCVMSAAVGAVAGYFFYAIGFLVFMTGKAGAAVSRLKSFNRVKRTLPEFMRQYEPDFSLDHFIGKLITLIDTLIYSDSFENLAVYYGENAAAVSDIIDTCWQGYFDLNNVYEKDGYIYLDINVHMDDVHCANGRLFRKNDMFNLVLCKRAYVPTDYGFSIHAVNCKGCGASFNAAREKHCPSCGREFQLYDYDWTVLRFHKVN